MIDPRRHSDAVQRNREPILGVLRAHVRPGDHVLELAAGTGEHAVFLAPRLGVGSWRATDPDPEARASVDAWRAVSDAPMVLPAEALGVHTGPWPAPGQVDVMVAINLVHISPWEATLALLDGAARVRPRVLYLYGPYRRGGAHTAPSNEQFDRWLKARDPAFGVRDLELVVAQAEARGLGLVEVVEMPANNLSVVLRVG